MTADEIRAQAIEVAAKARYMRNQGHRAGQPKWEDSDMACAYRSSAETEIDALAAAGLLPTNTTYAVVHDDFVVGCQVPERTYGHRESARAELDSWGGGGRMIRYLYTDWCEVGE